VAEPRATFLMAAYMAEDFVASAIESVLAQTVDDWELIVVDDGSTDRTPEIVASFADARIGLLRLERNGGQTAALNHGLANIRTLWVARLDADDVALPHRLEAQLAAAAANPGVVLVGGWADLIDESGRVVGSPRQPRGDLRRALIRTGNPIPHSCATFDAERARALGGYPATYSFAQDLPLWARLLRTGQAITLPQVLAQIRIHPAQMTRTTVALLGESMRALDEEVAPLAVTRADRRRLAAARARVRALRLLAELRRRNLRPAAGEAVRLLTAALTNWRVACDLMVHVVGALRYRSRTRRRAAP
jgi:hypothetical protein